MNYFSSKFKLGILGGGQLGKMILYSTRKFDIYTCVLDPSKDAPARLACDEFNVGDLLDYDTVIDFGKKVDILTIEIENVNVNALEKLENNGIKVYPSAKTLKTIQNKAHQKLFYRDHNIPTADFSRFAYTSEINEAVDNGGLSYPFVWKSAKFGYDGQGVKIVKRHTDLIDLPNVECIAENLIPFKNELAVIVARNTKGDLKTYPVVEMEFHPEANQVEYVICPARISDHIAKKAELVALKTAAAFEHIGLLAVEMFQTEDDDILVNEVAPRPHNSGHHTIECCLTSQFDQHIRSILNLPLGNTDLKIPGIMLNLVGENKIEGYVKYENIDEILDIIGVSAHFYGKKKSRLNRKMGHITVVNNNIEEALKIGKRIKKIVKVTA